MYYHIAMRIFLPTLVIILLGATTAFAEPEFILRDVIEKNLGLEYGVDWHSPRIFDGVGWTVGSASRGDDTVMRGGYTVVHPSFGEPFVVTNCFVMAAFDLLPQGYLLVTIRDPYYFWENLEPGTEVVDPIELVWYDKGWEEMYSTVLDFPGTDYPDDFILSPDEKSLLAILHPLDSESAPAGNGHSIVMINLKFGTITGLPLPEEFHDDDVTAAWGTLKMKWTEQKNLLVQVGKMVRLYKVQW